METNFCSAGRASAASFTRFARSARRSRRRSGEDAEVDVLGEGILRVWTWRMPSRPRTSAGRRHAAVEATGAQEAGRGRPAGWWPIRMTPSFDSKPSISTRRALSVCSRSSCRPEARPRWRPTASISSMKMRQGRSSSLLEEVADAEAPRHEHLDEVGAGDREERHVRLAGDRPARRVLPEPGAHQEDALGILPRASGTSAARAGTR